MVYHSHFLIFLTLYTEYPHATRTNTSHPILFLCRSPVDDTPPPHLYDASYFLRFGEEEETRREREPSLDLAVILEIMNCQDEPNEFIFYIRLCAFFFFSAWFHSTSHLFLLPAYCCYCCWYQSEPVVGIVVCAVIFPSHFVLCVCACDVLCCCVFGIFMCRNAVGIFHFNISKTIHTQASRKKKRKAKQRKDDRERKTEKAREHCACVLVFRWMRHTFLCARLCVCCIFAFGKNGRIIVNEASI